MKIWHLKYNCIPDKIMSFEINEEELDTHDFIKDTYDFDNEDGWGSGEMFISEKDVMKSLAEIMKIITQDGVKGNRISDEAYDKIMSYHKYIEETYPEVFV